MKKSAANCLHRRLRDRTNEATDSRLRNRKEVMQVDGGTFLQPTFFTYDHFARHAANRPRQSGNGNRVQNAYHLRTREDEDGSFLVGSFEAVGPDFPTRQISRPRARRNRVSFGRSSDPRIRPISRGERGRPLVLPEPTRPVVRTEATCGAPADRCPNEFAWNPSPRGRCPSEECRRRLSIL